VRENTVRTKWKQGQKIVNGWLGIPSSISAETMAHAGWDSLTVDTQHGIVDYQTAVTMMQAISTTPTIPLVRVPWFENGMIMKMLDAGAYGIICPMINSREEAEALVAACRYAPEGGRSFGPMRAMMYGGADYPLKANETILVIAMIETTKALGNLDSILSTPGLDGIYIGPNDLSLSMGFGAKGDATEPKVVAEIDRILQTAKKNNLLAGIHCTAASYANQMLNKGFDLVTITNDNGLLAAAARSAIATARGQDNQQAAAAPARAAAGPYG
jgi:4-hydroxy-2-oxoheptanedioate aldolase